MGRGGVLVKALAIFDVDGTLFQTDRVTVPAVQRTLAKFHGNVPDEQTIRRYIGTPVRQYHAWLGRQCPDAPAEQVAAATDALELSLIAETGALYPGVREMLEELRRDGVTLAACSNGPENYIRAVLDAFALRPLLSAVRVRDDRPDTKATMIAEIMDAFPAFTTVVMGDREEDIGAAHANGALAIGAAYGFGAPDELDCADAIAHAPEEIPETIRTLLATRSQHTDP